MAKAKKKTATPGWLGVTQVAARLRLRYHKARDLMLLGKLGEPKYEGRTLQVSEDGVRAYERALATATARGNGA